MPESFVVEVATAADVAAIVGLLADDDLGRTREAVDASADPAYLAAFEAIAQDPNQLQLVARLEGLVVGCLQITFIPGLSHRGAWRCHVEAVRIARHLRGQGYGRRMMARVIAEAEARGCRMVELTTNRQRTDAHEFYRALGFAESHTGFKLALPRPAADQG